MTNRTIERSDPVPARSTYSVGEFADQLGLAEVTVYRAIHLGHIPAIKFAGRYLVPAQVLDDLLEAAMTQGLVDIALWLPTQSGERDGDPSVSR